MTLSAVISPPVLFLLRGLSFWLACVLGGCSEGKYEMNIVRDSFHWEDLSKKYFHCIVSYAVVNEICLFVFMQAVVKACKSRFSNFIRRVILPKQHSR